MPSVVSKEVSVGKVAETKTEVKKVVEKPPIKSIPLPANSSVLNQQVKPAQPVKNVA
jgi:hypothetical protein